MAQEKAGKFIKPKPAHQWIGQMQNIPKLTWMDVQAQTPWVTVTQSTTATTNFDNFILTANTITHDPL
jgi:hypothetical protein